MVEIAVKAWLMVGLSRKVVRNVSGARKLRVMPELKTRLSLMNLHLFSRPLLEVSCF